MSPYQYDFIHGYQGWQPGFADFLPSAFDSYKFLYEARERPPTAGIGNALFISSMNRSDDVFMFHKLRLAGLEPNRRYKAYFKIALASKYVSASGVGGDPALSVYLKACASTAEPKYITDNVGLLRLDIDIGAQANAGQNSVVLGTIEKQSDGTDDYRMIERQSSKALVCASDDLGGVWILFGTDLGYEGETQLYYTYFEAIFE